jgi:hypothetical protein
LQSSGSDRLGHTTGSDSHCATLHNVRASALSTMERATVPVGASASHSTVYDEKPSRQPSISSATSGVSGRNAAAGQVHDDHHVTEKDGAVLEPVQSRHLSVRDASSIPNGGLWAWLQVLGSFFLLFNSWYVPLDHTHRDQTNDSSQGHHQHVRLLSSILRDRSSKRHLTLRNILDWIHSGLSPSHGWCPDWTTI